MSHDPCSIHCLNRRTRLKGQTREWVRGEISNEPQREDDSRGKAQGTLGERVWEVRDRIVSSFLSGIMRHLLLLTSLSGHGVCKRDSWGASKMATASRCRRPCAPLVLLRSGVALDTLGCLSVWRNYDVHCGLSITRLRCSNAGGAHLSSGQPKMCRLCCPVGTGTPSSWFLGVVNRSEVIS